MTTNIGVSNKFAEKILNNLQNIQDQSKSMKSENQALSPDDGKSFSDHMKESVGAVNNMQKTADKMATDLASGKATNIHETMLAASQAELSFNFMVQLRNKALEAYNEVMRMPV